jgi:hypothetical protein
VLKKSLSWASMRDKVSDTGTRTVRRRLKGQEKPTLSNEVQASRGDTTRGLLLLKEGGA